MIFLSIEALVKMFFDWWFWVVHTQFYSILSSVQPVQKMNLSQHSNQQWVNSSKPARSAEAAHLPVQTKTIALYHLVSETESWFAIIPWSTVRTRKPEKYRDILPDTSLKASKNCRKVRDKSTENEVDFLLACRNIGYVTQKNPETKDENPAVIGDEVCSHANQL